MSSFLPLEVQSKDFQLRNSRNLLFTVLSSAPYNNTCSINSFGRRRTFKATLCLLREKLKQDSAP